MYNSLLIDCGQDSGGNSLVGGGPRGSISMKAAYKFPLIFDANRPLDAVN